MQKQLKQINEVQFAKIAEGLSKSYFELKEKSIYESVTIKEFENTFQNVIEDITNTCYWKVCSTPILAHLSKHKSPRLTIKKILLNLNMQSEVQNGTSKI